MLERKTTKESRHKSPQTVHWGDTSNIITGLDPTVGTGPRIDRRGRQTWGEERVQHGIWGLEPGKKFPMILYNSTYFSYFSYTYGQIKHCGDQFISLLLYILTSLGKRKIYSGTNFVSKYHHWSSMQRNLPVALPKGFHLTHKHYLNSHQFKAPEPLFQSPGKVTRIVEASQCG